MLVDAASVDHAILGTTVIQKHGFYGTPWLTGAAGLSQVAGPTLPQACATGVRLLLASSQEIASGLEKPVVAALLGPVLGIGVELAMACHYRIVEGRSQLGMPELTLGVVPGAGGTQRLPRLIGVSSALDLLLTGKPVPAAGALEQKLIDEIAAGDLIEAAMAAAKRLIGEPPRRRLRRALPKPASWMRHWRRRHQDPGSYDRPGSRLSWLAVVSKLTCLPAVLFVAAARCERTTDY